MEHTKHERCRLKNQQKSSQTTRIACPFLGFPARYGNRCIKSLTNRGPQSVRLPTAGDILRSKFSRAAESSSIYQPSKYDFVWSPPLRL